MKFLNKSNPGAEHLETYHFERDLAEDVALQEPVGGGNGEQVVENELVVENEQVVAKAGGGERAGGGK